MVGRCRGACLYCELDQGPQDGKKRLYVQEGNDPSVAGPQDMDTINTSLSFFTDVSQAKRIEVNAHRNGGCFQGQTHGHKKLFDPITASERL